MKYIIYTLHSNMQTGEQRKVFKATPHNVRKIILSTNIAETSLNIDDVIYVIDSGKMKEVGFFLTDEKYFYSLVIPLTKYILFIEIIRSTHQCFGTEKGLDFASLCCTAKRPCWTNSARHLLPPFFICQVRCHGSSIDARVVSCSFAGMLYKKLIFWGHSVYLSVKIPIFKKFFRNFVSILNFLLHLILRLLNFYRKLLNPLLFW